MNPVPKRFSKRSISPYPQVIVKKIGYRQKRYKRHLHSEREFCAVDELKDGNMSYFGKLGEKKSRRSAEELPGSPFFIETAVFVDKDLYQHMRANFPSDTEKELVRFVLAMVNAVELLYNDPSLGRPVRFMTKRLEILHADPQGLRRSPDIDRFLGSFCTWQDGQNPPSDGDPLHWDHALILTGLDLYVLGKTGKLTRQVVGLAPVAGMCTATSSCTVNEGRHFESVYVVAHEIGHNLGMRHDGPLSENNCDPSLYLMSPTLGSGKTTWSSCSRHYLNQFLRSSQSKCLKDYSNSGTHIDHSEGDVLPGQRFSADMQCELKYGKGSSLSSMQPLDEICRDLHCAKGKYTWTSHPALEGTSCGVNKWCRRGNCVQKGFGGFQAVQQSNTSGWSEWNDYSECASGCLHGDDNILSSGCTGVMYSTRLCNNPRDIGREGCLGSDKKYKTCFPNQCENIPRVTIKNFADEVCSRAREVDSDIIGTGFQKNSPDKKEACTVWCHRKGGGAKSKGWIFPDGTVCPSPIGTKSYCISGQCQEFKCGNGEEVLFVEGTGCGRGGVWRDKRRELPVGVWRPVSDCYSACVTPGRGLRLVERRACTRCNVTTSIQLCHPTHTVCDSTNTATEKASQTCLKYKQKVRRLSGFGMQLSASPDDPDRPCRISCQDEIVHHRFYLVNGEEGWFPFGTDCSRGDLTKKAYCVSGHCLEFGSDDTPLHEHVFNFAKISSRKERSISKEYFHPMHDTSINKTFDRADNPKSSPFNFTEAVYSSPKSFLDDKEETPL